MIGDARRKAEEIVKAAEERAQGRREEVEEELESLRLKTKEEAYAQGYQEGLVDGEEKALQQAKDLLDLLRTTVDEGVRLRANGLAALEEDFLKLSLLLADKLVRKTIEDDISWLGPIIRDALYSLGTVSEIVVFVSPMDYSLIQEREGSLQAGLRTKIVFQTDPALNQGGCLIESENGLIDARLEQRLGKLGRSLMEVLYYENK
jgi:flagellar assembly protein FliH